VSPGWHFIPNKDFDRRGVAEAAPFVCFGPQGLQLILQGGNGRPQVVATLAHCQSQYRVGVVGWVEDTRLALFLLNVGIEELNAPSQVGDQRIELGVCFEMGHRLHRLASI
jgi:hypothetical protein